MSDELRPVRRSIQAIKTKQGLLKLLTDPAFRSSLFPSDVELLIEHINNLGFHIDGLPPGTPDDCTVFAQRVLADGNTTGWRKVLQKTIAQIRRELKNDTKKDTPKKKFRELSEAAQRCADEYHHYRSIGEKYAIRDIVRWYVAENGGSASSIQKQITDYKLLKSPTKKDTKRHR